MKVAFQSGNYYVIETGAGMGFLVYFDGEEISQRGPIVALPSIAAHMPYEDFQPFKGDGGPLLAKLKAAHPDAGTS